MFQDIQYIKTRANLIRQLYIEDMEKHLLSFEQKLIANQVRGYWVSDEEELCSHIIKSFEKTTNNKVVIDLPSVPKTFQEKKAILLR